MRAQSALKGIGTPCEHVANSRPSLAQRIDRLLDEMAPVVSVDPSHWRESLRMLLSHPYPPKGLHEFHKIMRQAIRRVRYDEAFVARVLSAVAACERVYGLGELLEPIRLALISFVGGIARRPSILMGVARKIIEGTDLEMPLRLSFSKIVKTRRMLAVSKQNAMACVVTAVQRAILVLLEERAIGAKAFADWPKDDCLAGLEALWLAFTYCGMGTGNVAQLDKADLRRDWAQCGEPLWRLLNEMPALSDSLQSDSFRVDRAADFSRLTLAVQATASSVQMSTSVLPGAVSPGLVHVVCRTVIPDSSDKQDTQEIARHRILERPLPVASMPPISLLRASKAQLLEEFPWAETALDVIFDDLIGRANLGVPDLTLPATLMVGLPGAGKSRLARRIAEHLKLPRLDICLAGTSDTKVIGGTSRGWSTGRPSDLASLLARRATASALVILDEIDKACDKHRGSGDVTSYLLGLLEPETACRHYDNFLKTECDFSKVSWLCTGNTLSLISRPLQSRLRILLVPEPRPEHFQAVGDVVVAELEKGWQLPQGTMPSIDKLEIDWGRMTNARQVRAATESAVSRWARDITKH